jgi:hypothetical protein
MNIAKPLFYAVALASLSLPACGGTAGEEEGSIGTATQAELGHGTHGGTCHGSLTFNSLTFNSLTFNSLTFNQLTQNALTENSLTFNGLTENSLTLNALTDPNARDVLAYVVSCALPADQTISVTVDGVEFSYQGQLGLAPEWGEADGSCGKDCQQWVSGCVISRLDFLGQKREISVRGENEGLKSCEAERETYTQREATYYGNIFVTPQLRYACLPPGQTEIPRVCGPSVDNCGVQVLGSCDDLCGHVRPDGSFPDCRVPDADDGQGHFDHDDAVYEGSVTVFLKP